VELLADRFITEDWSATERTRQIPARPEFFDEDEFEEVDTLSAPSSRTKTRNTKEAAGNKLWPFYTEYLKVQPQIAAETEEIVKHMVETVWRGV
jgi:hypothetical protein